MLRDADAQSIISTTGEGGFLTFSSDEVQSVTSSAPVALSMRIFSALAEYERYNCRLFLIVNDKQY